MVNTSMLPCHKIEVWFWNPTLGATDEQADKNINSTWAGITYHKPCWNILILQDMDFCLTNPYIVWNQDELVKVFIGVKMSNK